MILKTVGSRGLARMGRGGSLDVIVQRALWVGNIEVTGCRAPGFKYQLDLHLLASSRANST